MIGQNFFLVAEHQVELPLIRENSLLIKQRLVQLALIGEDPSLVGKDFLYVGHNISFWGILILFSRPANQIIADLRQNSLPTRDDQFGSGKSSSY